MAFAHKVVRCTAFGTAYGQDEEWSTGFWMGNTDSDSLDPQQQGADDFLTAWTTFFTNSTSNIASGFKTEGVRVALYGTNGFVDPNKNFHAYPTTPVQGGGGSGILPAQLALVASLEASPDRGLAGKGRMFLPGVNEPVGSDGRISLTDVLPILTNLRTMFNSINASTVLTGSIINASKGGTGQNLAPPVNRVVANVRMGNVYDTQRRRRNSLTETYQSLAVTA